MRHLTLLTFFSLPAISLAADLNGSTLNLLWGLPFAMILMSIALGPLFFSYIWHHHFGKITAFWTLSFLIPFSLIFGAEAGIRTVVHALIEEYIPFILLLLALYTISGGIFVGGNLRGTPKLNTALLAVGTSLASIMGTTGAAMLMIRPLLKANQTRTRRVHIVIFFIFLVANIGGGLTPLGDPPLFLGFLKGVDFMWTVKHMLAPVLISAILLLTAFYFIDNRLFKQDVAEQSKATQQQLPEKITIFGKWNFLGLEILGSHYALQNLARDLVLIILTAISIIITPKQVRAGNEFNFDPIAEVGKLFLGIFITIFPVLSILKAGEAGALGGVVSLVHDAGGNPVDTMYFWMSGILSSFLDNAPTYLVFFNMAGGDAHALMTGPLFHSLLAVSMGSVFMGALTYIGNAPNFMVKAIAEQRGIPMPTFFGYMAWSVAFLVPIFILHTFIFFIFKLL